MSNTFYFLRHGKTQLDPNEPISKWILSDVGRRQALEVAESGQLDDIDAIFASTETKAIETARPLAERLRKEILQEEDLSELDRDKGGFMSAEQYEHAVKECLARPQESVSSWETARHALQRFSMKINEIDARYDDMKILIVGHGFTINLYFAEMLGQLDRVYERLQLNDFCDWGIIRDRKVIKDLGKPFERVGERLMQ